MRGVARVKTKLQVQVKREPKNTEKSLENGNVSKWASFCSYVLLRLQ